MVLANLTQGVSFAAMREISISARQAARLCLMPKPDKKRGAGTLLLKGRKQRTEKAPDFAKLFFAKMRKMNLHHIFITVNPIHPSNLPHRFSQSIETAEEFRDFARHVLFHFEGKRRNKLTPVGPAI